MNIGVNTIVKIFIYLKFKIKINLTIYRMSKSMAYIILIGGVIITLPIFFITIPVIIIMNNKLVSLKNKTEFSFSGIDVMLKKRYDLIPNLVSSVKTYMKHEESLLTKVTELRSKLLNTAGQSDKRFELENELTGALGQIQVTMENYPELKANQNILHLQKVLHETEEQISAARRAYNFSVVKFNESIESIPLNIMAGAKSMKPFTYFSIPETEKSVPNLDKLFA